eukprot:1556550-Amphidinium_carterae.1
MSALQIGMKLCGTRVLFATTIPASHRSIGQSCYSLQTKCTHAIQEVRRKEYNSVMHSSLWGGSSDTLRDEPSLFLVLNDEDR